MSTTTLRRSPRIAEMTAKKNTQYLEYMSKPECAECFAKVSLLIRGAYWITGTVNLINYIIITDTAHELFAVYPPMRYDVAKRIEWFLDFMPSNSEIQSCKLLYDLMLNVIRDRKNYVA